MYTYRCPCVLDLILFPKDFCMEMTSFNFTPNEFLGIPNLMISELLAFLH